MPAPATVRLTRPLFDTYPDTGYRFLAYPAGAEISVSEYVRLAPKFPRAGEMVVPSDPEPAPPEPEPLADMPKARILVIAKQRGLAPNPRMTKDQLIALIEGTS